MTNHREFEEAGLKFAARLFLLNCKWHPRDLLTPDADEWHGLNALDRDGQLLQRRDRDRNRVVLDYSI